RDPAAEKRAQRGADSFAELADRYLEEHAKRWNNSWKQGERRVRKYLLPRWGKLPAKSITRRDVLAIFGRIKAPLLANQVLKAVSAVFGCGVKMEIIGVNPCIGIEVNPTQSRERILGDDEFPKFWQAFGTLDVIRGSALKVLLLTGQRPGEVAHMRHDHI